MGERVTLTWMIFRDLSSMMKKAKSGRKKRSVTCKRITGLQPRHLCRMIEQERFPGLSRGPFWARVLHIFLDGPFDFSEYPA